MEVLLEGGSSSTWKIARAVLFYAEDGGRRVLATAHEVREVDRRLEIGEGTTLAKAAVHQLIVKMGERVKDRHPLPANVLWHEPEVVVWWRPSQRGTLFFRTGDAEFDAATTGAMVVHPPLLFVAYRRRLWMWALKENKRPGPATPLFYAPYMNVSTAGWVCTGSAIPPMETTLHTMRAWEDTVFDSYFSHSGIPFGRWKTVREFWSWFINETQDQRDRDGGSGRKSLPFPTDSLKRYIDGETGREVDLEWLLQTNLGRILAGRGEGHYAG